MEHDLLFFDNLRRQATMSGPSLKFLVTSSETTKNGLPFGGLNYLGNLTGKNIMGIELANTRLALAAGSNAPPVQKIRPMKPSFAEEAVFIPKPYKRVEFRLELPVQRAGTAGVAVWKAGGTAGYAVSAASNAPKVVMRVDPDPQKDYSVISLQQEGRQINHGSSVYFLEQYDAYGRPRMGMSREPYDFAFTKFMVKTSQLKCEENVKASSDANKKMKAGTGASPNEAPQGGPAVSWTDSNLRRTRTPVSILA